MLEKSEVLIREIKTEEINQLEEMLYASIFQVDKTNPIPREIIKKPRIWAYIDNFGSKNDDHCLVAILNGQIIGAVWVRIITGKIKGYGNVDDKTPEFAIALLEGYRNQGIGTLLMQKMISLLIKKGYKQASLSVQKENYALKLYENLNFKIIDENNEDYIMLLKL